MRAPSQCNLQLQSDVKEAIKEADSERAAYQAFLTTEAAQTADPDTVAQMESEIAEVSVGPLERAGFEARVRGQWARRGLLGRAARMLGHFPQTRSCTSSARICMRLFLTIA